MPLRIPPGRTGRLWLAHRLALARRAGEVLDEKVRALASAERRLAAEAAEAAAAWDEAIGQAERWVARAVVAGGQRQLGLVAAHTSSLASIEVAWRSWMGIAVPVEAGIRPGQPGPSSLGGTLALDMASAAYARALEVGVQHGRLELALAQVRGELTRSMQRKRMIEKHHLPELESTRRRLDQHLEVLARENGVRTRWLRAPAEKT